MASTMRAEAKSKKEKAEHTLVNRHFHAWRTTLDMRTKKSLWKSLARYSTPRYPPVSLGTFYKHLGYDFDQYLRPFFLMRHDTILASLEINDVELREAFAEVERLLDMAERNVRAACVGGPGDMRKSMFTRISW